MNTKMIVFFMIVTSLLSACAGHSKQRTGAFFGSFFGWTGANYACENVNSSALRATCGTVGTVVGALLGGAIGRYLDENDRRMVQNALEKVPDHQPVKWNNPNGNKFQFVAIKTYENRNRQNCRQYDLGANVQGKRENVRQNACREGPGIWKDV